MLGGCTTYAAKSDPNPASYKDIYEGAISIHNHLIQSGDQGIMMGVPSFLIVNREDETIAGIAKSLYLPAFGSSFQRYSAASATRGPGPPRKSATRSMS